MKTYGTVEDTIAAISTPPGRGGIGIVRISGPEAFAVASRIYGGRSRRVGRGEGIRSHERQHAFGQLDDRRMVYGRITDPITSETADDVNIVKMIGPATYTGEDTVEIYCHGSPVILKKVLGLAVANGARPAEPGEFTKRAFINGRLDLAQAEAVADLVSSMTSLGARTALGQLEGNLSIRIKAARDQLVSMIAEIDASLDYPEHDIEAVTASHAATGLEELRRGLAALSEGFEYGRIIREGLSVVIAGRPNVGKSSLFNEFAGKDRAIVADMPGTTRDTIDEYVNISGIPVRVTDTAGIRPTGASIERMGVTRSLKAVKEADIIIFMFDISQGLTIQDLEVLDDVEKALAEAGKTAAGSIIAVGNKLDLTDAGTAEARLEDARIGLGVVQGVISTSMKDGTGFPVLMETIRDLHGSSSDMGADEPVLTNIRHKGLVDAAIASIDEALRSYREGMPVDCMEIDIRQAVHSLAEITGENASEEIIKRIFEKFCIGK